MSEFKFACPVCGQHLTAAPENSGATIECPTCFRAIVVPQARAAADNRLVMTASEADKPRIPGTAPDVLPLKSVKPRLPLPHAGLLLIVGAVCAYGFTFYGEKLWRSSSHDVQRSETRLQEKLKAQVAPAWSMDPAAPEAQPGSKPASGMLHGGKFVCERAVLRGNHLVLRQGAGPHPDLGMTVSLPFAPTNSTRILSDSNVDGPQPQLVLRWSDEQGKAASKLFKSGYLLNLVLDYQPPTNRATGRIYAALPDDARSFVAGTFSAEVLPMPPQRRGRTENRKRRKHGQFNASFHSSGCLAKPRRSTSSI